MRNEEKTTLTLLWFRGLYSNTFVVDGQIQSDQWGEGVFIHLEVAEVGVDGVLSQFAHFIHVK